MSTENNAPQAPQGGAGPKHHTVMAVLAYIGILVVIPFLVSKDDPFVKFHIKQGLVLFVLWLILWVVGWMFMSMASMFALIMNIVQLALLVLVIVGIVNAVQGKEKELPLVGHFASHFKF